MNKNTAKYTNKGEQSKKISSVKQRPPYTISTIRLKNLSSLLHRSTTHYFSLPSFELSSLGYVYNTCKK